MSKLLEKIIRFTGDIKFHKYPLFLIYKPHTFLVKGKHYYEARDILKPGDIILTDHHSYLSSYLIPGQYSHVAIYVGNDKVIHASPNGGVCYIDLVQIMRCDNFAIVRPKLTDVVLDKVIKKAESVLGRGYDYLFLIDKEKEIGSRDFFCSELILFSFREHQHILGFTSTSRGFGPFKRNVFSPDDCLPEEGSASEIIYKV